MSKSPCCYIFCPQHDTERDKIFASLHQQKFDDLHYQYMYNMMKEDPQSTHNKQGTWFVSGYERMNCEIEKFIDMVDKEEHKLNKVLHNKSTPDEDTGEA